MRPDADDDVSNCSGRRKGSGGDEQMRKSAKYKWNITAAASAAGTSGGDDPRHRTEDDDGVIS